MVTKCVCFDLEFSEILPIAIQYGCTTIEALQNCMEFGKKCERCHPYIQKMLETHETEFEVIPL